jgi:membrane protein DedA with SNARE-associated domain
LTDLLLYHVGKKYGREVVEHKRFQKIISPERLSKIEKKFKKWGIWVIFFGRHIFGIRAQVFLAAGVVRMPALKFLIADAASAIITVTVMVGLGYFGGNSVQILKKHIIRIEHIILIALIVFLAAGRVYWYFHNLKNMGK